MSEAGLQQLQWWRVGHRAAPAVSSVLEKQTVPQSNLTPGSFATLSTLLAGLISKTSIPRGMQGVALAARTLGCSAVICMPTNSPEIKINAVRELGGTVELVGESFFEAQVQAMVCFLGASWSFPRQLGGVTCSDESFQLMSKQREVGQGAGFSQVASQLGDYTSRPPTACSKASRMSPANVVMLMAGMRT